MFTLFHPRASLRRAVTFFATALVVAAAGADDRTSTVSLWDRTIARAIVGDPFQLLLRSSFEPGEVQPRNCFSDGGDIDQDGLLDLACTQTFVPPEPATVAPPLDPTVPANYYDATVFLYEGPNSIQRGMRPGVIEDFRVTVMRGLVRDDQGAPLPGVLVRVLDHPEFGYTYTRSDGMFDLAVNGGGDIVVHYTKSGYLRAQRRIDTPWNDWRWVDDATLIAIDSAVTTVNTAGGQGPTLARANPVIDADGTRRATAFFPAGTQATLRFADGSTQPQAQIHFRATEYTVGPNGRERMPANLPTSTAYTYAVELSADEAIAANAQSVEFNIPVAIYVDNYRDFPVGVVIPAGTYDFRQASWNPEENGLVIKILGIVGGLATIDIDGSGQPASEAEMIALGLSAAERSALGSTYPSGSELWRYRASHFSPHDFNLPFFPGPDDRPPPEQPQDDPDDGDPEQPPMPGDGNPCNAGANCDDMPLHPDEADDEDEEDPCMEGSIIRCNSRALEEEIQVPGTQLSLRYHSRRVPARTFSLTRVLSSRVRMTGLVVPPSLRKATLNVYYLGRTGKFELSPLTPNYVRTTPIELTDAYSRQWHGPMRVRYGLTYSYPVVRSSNENRLRIFWERFAVPGGLSFGGGDEDDVYAVTRFWDQASRSPRNGRQLPGFWDARGQGFGGWTLSDHHVYDAMSDRIYAGTGKRLQTRSTGGHEPQVAQSLVRGVDPRRIRNGRRLATSPDGSIFVILTPSLEGIPKSGGDAYTGSDAYSGLVRVRTDGIIEPWGSVCSTQLESILCDVAVDANERAVVTDGASIQRVLGPENFQTIADASTFPEPCTVQRLATRNQRVYFTCAQGWVGMLWPDGSVTRIIGGGSGTTDGVAAEDLQLLSPTEVAVDSRGSVHVYDSARRVLWRVRDNGVVETVLGDGTASFTPDGTTAKGAAVGTLKALAITSDDRVFYSEASTGRVREIRANGRIYTHAGGGNQPSATLTAKGSIARSADLSANDIDILPEGSVVFLGTSSTSEGTPIGAVANSSFVSYRGYGGLAEGFNIPSRSGSEIYSFDSRGRHLETRHALTGGVKRRFEYNARGYLTEIEDGDGNVTRIERAADDKPTAIVNPDGVRTGLNVSSSGYLTSITTPTNDTWNMDYFSDGLLRTLEDPRGGLSTFAWSPEGRLLRDENAESNAVELLHTSHASIGQNYVAVNTAMGRQPQFSRNVSEQGGISRVNNDASGARIGRGADQKGAVVTSYGHGVEIRSQVAADPRFGPSVALPESVVTTLPENDLVRTATFQREAIPLTSDPGPGQVGLSDTHGVNGRIYRSTYNASSRVWTATSPAGRSVSITMDAQQRPLSIATPGLATVGYDYDARGRLIEIAAGSGSERRATLFGYDTRGYLGDVRDAELRSVAFTNDASGRTVVQRLPDTRNIGFRYDPASNVVGITPPGRNEHGFGYTPLQRLNRYAPPSLPAPGPVATNYTYNPDRQMTGVARPDGDAIELTYGSNTGLLERIGSDLHGVGYTIDGYGRMFLADADFGWKTAWAWNGFLPTRQTVTLAENLERHVRFGYDNNFWLRSIDVATTAVGGTVASTAYAYDNDGLLTAATTGSAAMSLSHHTGNGLLTGSALGAVTDTWSHNGFAEPSAYTTRVSGAAVFATNFVRDKLGRITRKTEVEGGTTRVFDYAYDLAGRLETVERDDAVIASYTFDSNSNRIGAQYAAPLSGALATCAPAAVNGVVTLTGVVDAQDRLTRYGTCTFAYTRNGELTTKIDSNGSAVTTYVYDAMGNLRTVDLPDGRAIEYVIDGINRRVGKKVGGVLTQGFLYLNQLEPVAELDANGNIIATFVYADRAHVPAYMLKGGSVYRLVSDHLGSVRLAINTATGAIAQRIDYDAFGNITADTNPGLQPFGYAGGLHDRDTGLVRFGARDYDPVTGRWTAKDPIGFAAGDSNLYAYADSDVINHIDRNGNNPVLVAAGVVLIGIAIWEAGTAIRNVYLAAQAKAEVTARNLANAKAQEAAFDDPYEQMRLLEERAQLNLDEIDALNKLNRTIADETLDQITPGPRELGRHLIKRGGTCGIPSK